MRVSAASAKNHSRRENITMRFSCNKHVVKHMMADIWPYQPDNMVASTRAHPRTKKETCEARCTHMLWGSHGQNQTHRQGCKQSTCVERDCGKRRLFGGQSKLNGRRVDADVEYNTHHSGHWDGKFMHQHAHICFQTMCSQAKTPARRNHGQTRSQACCLENHTTGHMTVPYRLFELSPDVAWA